MNLKEIASLIDGTLDGKGGDEIRGVGPLEEAERGEITFLEKSSQLLHLKKTKASCVILPLDLRENYENDFKTHPLPHEFPTLLWVKNPRLAFLQVMERFQPQGEFQAGIHPTVLMGREIRLDPTVSISPYGVLGDHVEIGARTRVGPFAYMGQGVRIGSDCLLYPHVTLLEGVEIGNRCILHPGIVLGSDGFGFVPLGNAHRKVPQMGQVIIEDDCEVGANVTIDRATLGATRIGRGTKIDNLVHIAHNVEIGEGCLIAAQVGIAGSTKIGKRVLFGGQAGLVDHIRIGDEVQIGAQAGVTKSFPEKTTISGYPARPHHQAMRIYAAMHRLPELLKKIEKLLKNNQS